MGAFTDHYMTPGLASSSLWQVGSWLDEMEASVRLRKDEAIMAAIWHERIQAKHIRAFFGNGLCITAWPNLCC